MPFADSTFRNIGMYLSWSWTKANREGLVVVEIPPAVEAGLENILRGAKLDRWRPAVAWIVFHHGPRDFAGFFAQVFLVDDAVFANNERHNP